MRFTAAAVLSLALVAQPARAADSLKIGALIPTTGVFAALGERQLNGMRLAIEEFGGEIAGRNTLATPWTNRIDARVARTFTVRRSGRLQRAELLVDLFNLGHLLNRRWGAQYLLPAGISSQNPVVNRVPLLRVIGFDPATKRYRYSVNESAGVLPRGGDPFQLQVGVRFAP